MCPEILVLSVLWVLSKSGDKRSASIPGFPHTNRQIPPKRRNSKQGCLAISRNIPDVLCLALQHFQDSASPTAMRDRQASLELAFSHEGRPRLEREVLKL